MSRFSAYPFPSRSAAQSVNTRLASDSGLRRNSVLAMVLVGAVLSGCQQQGSDSDRIAGLLEPVPADTPYLMAVLDHQPEANFRHYVDVFAPRIVAVIDAMEEAAAADLEGHGDADVRHMRFMMNELRDYYANPDDIEQHRMVVYGNGLFPVVRVELNDIESMQQKLESIHTEFSVNPATVSLNGHEIYRAPLEEAGLVAYYGVIDDFLVGTVLPKDSEQLLLEQTFGGPAPQDALDPAELETLSKKHDFTNYFLGYVDVVASSEQLLSPDAAFMRWLEANAPEDKLNVDALDEVCLAEMRDMMQIAPRIDMGLTQLDKSGYTARTIVQLREDIAAGIQGLTGDLSGLDEDPGGALAMGVSLRVGAMRDFIIEMARNVQNAPYACAELDELNQSAEQVLAQAGTPIPPFVGQVRGLKFRIDEFQGMLQQQAPKMSMALFVENAQLLMSMAQMFMPQLGELGLEPDGEPVRIDEAMGGMPVDLPHAAYAALTDGSIGFALGNDQAASLPDMMAESGSADGVLFALWMDYRELMDIQRQALQQSFEQGLTDEQIEALSDDPDASELLEALSEVEDASEARGQAVVEKLLDLYEPFGRTSYHVRPMAQSVVVEQSMALKDVK